jgi:tRNA (guanine-N7-)-methyltransferase
MPGGVRPTVRSTAANRLHGRRKGKKLSARRSALMAGLLPALNIDIDRPPPSRAADLFSCPVDTVRLEIGFGGGEHLVAEAEAAPGSGFIGVEPFISGMAKAVAAIADRGLRNVRLFDGDAARLLDWLPAGSLSRIDLLYPDPWPKKRHWKRRFVSPENLDRISRVLMPGGELRFVSDISGYVEWTLSHILRRNDFMWTAQKADDWRRPWSGWPGTRYEAKAFKAGRRPAYLIFRRVSAAP